MKDPLEAVRSAYYQRLEGNLTLNGAVVRVHSGFALSSSPRPYVLLSTQTVSQRAMAKSCQGSETTILIDIVTEFPENGVKVSHADRIAGQVVALMDSLRTVGNNNTGEFEVIGHTLYSSNNLQEINGANLINRRLLRFRDELAEIQTIPG